MQWYGAVYCVQLGNVTCNDSFFDPDPRTLHRDIIFDAVSYQAGAAIDAARGVY